ncbi:unnamed protein product [Peniophora sp. CBMAI 1063]|nr:unnamed protein product [Peniophora sp. CBMAI 1063]
MKFSTILPVLVAAASPAAAFTRVFLDTASGSSLVEFLDSSSCNNISGYTSEVVTRIEPNDGLFCTVYDTQGCTGNSATGVYSVGQAPQNLATLASFWCYPTNW